MKKILLGLFSLLFVLGLSFLGRPEIAQANNEVTICHATGSNSNPYTKLEVDDDAVDGNGSNSADHNRSGHQNGEDIIPPGPWDADGRNWTPENQAIWENECDTPVKTVQITHNELSCGAANRTFSGTANFQGAHQDHLVVKLDGVQIWDSHDELSNWTTPSVSVGLGSHTVTATIFDDYSHGQHKDKDAEAIWQFTVNECPTPINCVMSEWSVCSAQCGTGTRTRTIVTQPANGGLACGVLEESCNIRACPTATPVATPAPTATPEPTATPVPTATPAPTPNPTPEPSAGQQSKTAISDPICRDNNFDAKIQLSLDGKPVKDVQVKFVYNNEAKFSKTGEDGWALVAYGYREDTNVEFYPEQGYPTQLQKVVLSSNCKAPTVLGATTAGSVLGATTMAKAGIIEETIVNLMGLAGAGLTAAGTILYAKKRN